MPQPFTVTSEPAEIAGGSGCVFRMTGTFGADGTDELERAVRVALDDGAVHFVMDFAGAEYISSGVLRLLLKLRRKTRDLGGSVRVAALRQSIREYVFDALGFSRLFEVHADAAEAVAAAGEAG